jgi:hypothetical protein
MHHSAQNSRSTHAGDAEAKFLLPHPHVEANAKGVAHDARWQEQHSEQTNNKQIT